MGKLILCTGKQAEQPFRIESTGVALFTMEEICYYIEQNYYLLDRSFLCHELAVWIARDLGYTKFGAELDRSLFQNKSLYPSAFLILKKSCLYTVEELASFEELFQNMDGKTALECRKLKADQYLQQRRYVMAALEYGQLLERENSEKMTDELRGALYHNRGVAYARLFLFPEAAECFRQAYKQNHNARSREAYLFAENYLKLSEDDTDAQDEEIQETGMQLTFSVMRDAIERFHKATAGNGVSTERQKLQTFLDEQGRITREKRQQLLETWKQEYLLCVR